MTGTHHQAWGHFAATASPPATSSNATDTIRVSHCPRGRDERFLTIDSIPEAGNYESLDGRQWVTAILRYSPQTSIVSEPSAKAPRLDLHGAIHTDA